VKLAAVLLNFQACFLLVSVFQWLQSGFLISTLIALVMHNMEWVSMDETLKNQHNEDTGFIPELTFYTSWYHVSHIDIDIIAS